MSAQPATQDLLYTVDNGVGLITFNRPAARNALTFAMYQRLAEVCAGAAKDGAKVLIITGAGGKAFAAGTDISQFRDFKGGQDGLDYEEMFEKIQAGLEACPLPMIAALTGACTGGGAAIAACCDLRIATKDVKFGFPIARTLGNCLSASSLARFASLIGEARVKDMIFTSRLLGGEEALAAGLVTELYDTPEALMARAKALATEMCGYAPLTLSATKEMFRRLRAARPDVKDADLIAEVYGSADFREGLESFLAKRKPEWKGK